MLKFSSLSKNKEQIKQKKSQATQSDEHVIKETIQSKDKYNNRRVGEPGIKEPTSTYKQIGQMCDICGDVYTHFLDLDHHKIMCSNCGKVSKVGESTQTVLSNIILKNRQPVEYSLFNLFICAS